MAVPRGVKGSLVVPEGITTLPENVFADLDVSDYYIPDSVFRFAPNTFGGFAQDFTIHCPEGSAASAYAQRYGFDYEIVGEGGVSDAAARNEFSKETQELDGCTLVWRVYVDHAELVDMQAEMERFDAGDQDVRVRGAPCALCRRHGR